MKAQHVTTCTLPARFEHRYGMVQVVADCPFCLLETAIEANAEHRTLTKLTACEHYIAPPAQSGPGQIVIQFGT